jgi:lysophospholipase L1-like esterase
LRANYDIIIPRLLEALTVEGERQGDLLIMNYYNPYPGLENPFDPGLTTDTWVPRYNQIIRDAAEAYGVPMAEVAAAFEGNEESLIYADVPDTLIPPLDPALFDFHPTPAGHAEIAQAYLGVSGLQSSEQLFLPLVQQ